MAIFRSTILIVALLLGIAGAARAEQREALVLGVLAVHPSCRASTQAERPAGMP